MSSQFPLPHPPSHALQNGEQRQLCDATVSGLSIKAMSTVSPTPASSSGRASASGQPGNHEQLGGSTGAGVAADSYGTSPGSTQLCSVLEPCDLSIHFQDSVGRSTQKPAKACRYTKACKCLQVYTCVLVGVRVHGCQCVGAHARG